MLKVRDESSMLDILPPVKIQHYVPISGYQWPHAAQMLRRKLSKIELRPEDREEVGRPGACHALASSKLLRASGHMEMDNTGRVTRTNFCLQAVIHLWYNQTLVRYAD